MSTSASTPKTETHGADFPACRICGASLRHTFVDLGMSPLCETYHALAELSRGEHYYPLHVYVCAYCFLVQMEPHASPREIFSDYPYFSAYSDSWLEHSEAYCEKIAARLGLNGRSLVVEVGSNDGYLLQYFLQRGVPVLGVEPAANVAQAALERGVPTLVRFFGAPLAAEMASQGRCADLVVGNNVLAQVPDLHDFVAGLRTLLKPAGVLTLEFPHLLRLIEDSEFDTIYHEHLSYFSLRTALRILDAHGLTVFDVEQLPTHGGSLRIYARLWDNPSYPIQPEVGALIMAEESAGLAKLEGYRGFAEQARQTKLAFVEFLLCAARAAKSVAGYGAPGKSATLLHYCGIGKDLIAYTVDRNPRKQGRYLPGSHIPIYHPDHISQTRPDYVVIFPWNLKDEIMEQLSFIRTWGGRFVVPIPRVVVCEAPRELNR
jgi:SAM-dependent methyltransferase